MPRRFVLLLAGLCALLLIQPTRAQAPGPGIPPDLDQMRKVPVILVAGQSNAEGPATSFWLYDPAGGAPQYSHLANQPNVKIWWPGDSTFRPGSPAAWENYRTGEELLRVNNGGYYIQERAFGVEAAIGHSMSQRLGEPVYVFKFTRVARLHPANDPSWHKDAGPDNLYDELLAEWRRAAVALRAQGLTPDIRGMFWLHGESDRDQMALEYAQRLGEFITDLRHDLAGETGDDDRPALFPFVQALLHPNHLPASYWDPHETEIRKQQKAAAAADPLVIWVETAQLSLDPNAPTRIHFDEQGTVDLGVLMADAWWELVKDE